MTYAQELASFAVDASFEKLSPEACRTLKVRILDALGCAIAAVNAEPIRMLRRQIDEFGGNPCCSLIGGGRTAPDRAALYNSALVRYLDYNDCFLARAETCHPSDNLGSVLAATEFVDGDGRELLTALAVAYQVQCRLSEVAPVRARGFDHTVQGAYALAAGLAKALRLTVPEASHAIALCGTAFNALRVTRTGVLSHWKGLAYPNLAFCCVHAAFLAMHGITGPLGVFEGNKGFIQSIAGPFTIDWRNENLEIVRRTIIKRYNAEVHSQSAVEALLDLHHRYGLDAESIERVSIEIFDVAYHIIGGGDEGAKTAVRTKEEADHSLPYIAAVALLDGRVTPDQFVSERIRREDVQSLLRRVSVVPNDTYSRRFPDAMPCRVVITLQDGRTLAEERIDYEGFHTRAMAWPAARAKFESLAWPFAGARLRNELAGMVADMESVRVSELMTLLAQVQARE